MSTESDGKELKVTADTGPANVTSATAPAAAQNGAVGGAGAGAGSPSEKNGDGKDEEKGDPIAVAKGAAVENIADVQLPGAFPFEWRRRYSSAEHKKSTSLGRGGWKHDFDQWLEPLGSGFTLHNWQGVDLDFGPLTAQATALHRGRSLLLKRLGDSFDVLELATRATRHYAPAFPGGRALLRCVADGYGNKLTLHYQHESLVRITDTVGREVHLRLDAKHRIAALDVESNGEVARLATYSYSDDGDLIAAADALGHPLRYAYDGLHRLVEYHHRNGFRVSYRYHPVHGRVVESSGTDGYHHLEFDYDFDKRTTTISGNPGPRVFSWDERGNVVREATFDERHVIEKVFDADNLLLERRNAAGETERFSYDAEGLLTSHTDAAGNLTTIERVDGLVRRVVRPNNLVRSYDYDGFGGLWGVTLETGARYSVDRDRRGRITAVYGPNGLIEHYAYDGHDNLIQVTGALGETTHYAYDILGRAYHRKDALGRETHLRYDAASRIQGIVRADGTRVDFEHDAAGNVTRIKKPGGDIELGYEGTGLVNRVKRENGSVWKIGYTRDEKPRVIENAANEKYQFVYDRAGRIEKETTFDGRVLEYRYDLAGHLQRFDRPDGSYREFAYDPLGNLLEEQSSHGPIRYQRDVEGRLLEATLVEGPVLSQVVFQRDAFGRIVAESQDGALLRYSYDNEGRLATRTLPSGETTQFRYDLAGRFVEAEHQGQIARFTRDLAGQELRRELLGTAARVETRHDALGRLASQDAVAPKPEGQGAVDVLIQRRWQYDAAGHLTALDDARWGLAAFRYDNVDNLVGYTRRGVDRAFEYDPGDYLVGIFEGLAPRGQAWGRRAGDVLATAGTAEYETDTLGRRTGKKEHGKVGEKPQQTGYTWDCRDRLREVRLPSGETARYFYDAFGRRTRKVIFPKPQSDMFAEPEPTRVTRFLWEGNVLAAELDTTHGARVWVHQPGTFLPLLQAEQGEVFLYVLDHLGMARELLDQRGRVAWAAVYDPWGAIADTQRDTSAPRKRAVESPFRMLGHYWDEETGLASTRFRYWDPRVGRWLSPDPLGIVGGRRLFGFDGCPVLDVDPWGLSTKSAEKANGVARKDLGAAREQAVADLVGGKVSNEEVIHAPWGKTDIDVEGPNGELIMVGGPSKAGDHGNVGRVMKIYQAEAAQRGGVPVQAYFVEGTPQTTIDFAVKRLGAENVKTFPEVT